MCARYTMRAPSSDISALFEAEIIDEVEDRPRYNVAPTDLMPVVRRKSDGRRVLDHLKWGLVPTWAKDPKIGASMINARVETIFEKPAFRTAIRKRRCLIPADGFYEWETTPDKRKQPWHFRVGEGEVFAFGGLYENGTYSVLTCPPNSVVAPLHDRMPVIVERGDYDAWLSTDLTDGDLSALMVPLADHRLSRVAVDPRVGNVRNDEPSLLTPQVL